MPHLPNTATSQEVFDFVANHLRKQGMPATEHGECRYRAIHNKQRVSCAVGCLITNEEYSSQMEQISFQDLLKQDLLPTRDTEGVLTLWGQHKELLQTLQSLHDASNAWHTTENLEKRLKILAHDYKLNYTEPQKCLNSPTKCAKTRWKRSWLRQIFLNSVKNC